MIRMGPQTGRFARDGADRAAAGSDAAEDAEAVALAADWADIVSGLRKDLGHQLFTQWIRPIELGPLCKATGTLDLYLPTEFSANWVQDRLQDRLALAWKIARAEVRTVRIAVHPGRRKPIDLELRTGEDGLGHRAANDGLRLAEAHLGGPLRFSAVMAANDDMAAAFVNTALRRGLHLPDDLSVTGFDDTPIASKIWPGLTTVRQPLALIAEQATELLVNMLRDPAAPRPGTSLVDYELITRASVGPPAHNRPSPPGQ